MTDVLCVYDGEGNLRYRHNISSGIEQNFTFDGLNRLLTTTGYRDQTMTYAANGNILTKSDVEDGAGYQYNNGTNGSHAVTGIGNLGFEYDANGNQTAKRYTSGANQYLRRVTYSHFDKPTQINGKSNDATGFEYGPGRNRYKRHDVKDGFETTTYYVGNVEVVILPSGVVETKRYVANKLQITRSNGTSKTQYLYKDHLGSLDTVTNDDGEIENKQYFDPFGLRNDVHPGNWSLASQAVKAISLVDITDTTNRGFTGHEHIDTANIIHMNGRIYDPVTARFMQADPIVQAADNSQNLNRYSYVLNNPLRYTDPSGFKFRGLGRFFKKWTPVVLTAIIAYATGGAGGAFTPSTGQLVAGGAMSGWVSSGFTFKGAAIGALTMGINSQTGGLFTSALVGGMLSKAQGGKFDNGAVSAAFASALRQDWSNEASSFDSTPTAKYPLKEDTHVTMVCRPTSGVFNHCGTFVWKGTDPATGEIIAQYSLEEFDTQFLPQNTNPDEAGATLPEKWNSPALHYWQP